jgi:adenosylmethionine-8-amino-7-oxononanoate aminotransferase
VVLAKGIGAGYTPLGIMVVSAAMNDAIGRAGGFNFGHTYNANPMTCAIGAAVLDVVVKEGLIDRAASRGRYLRQRLHELAATSRTIGDVRGIGLLQAIELVADKDTKAKLPSEFSAPDLLRKIALDDGLIIYSRRTNRGKFGDWVMITPPLTISEGEIDEIIARLGDSVRNFEAELGRRGVALGKV